MITRMGARAETSIAGAMVGHADAGARLRSRYRIECHQPCGRCAECQSGQRAACRTKVLAWVEDIPNTIMVLGANLLLDNTFTTSAAGPVQWYVGLKSSGASTQADTIASHATWTETTNYSGTRPQWVRNSSAGSGAMSNSASKASFSMGSTYTAGGAFLVSENTIGGAVGTLYGAALFSATRSGGSGDTLTVQVDLTASG